MNSTFPLHNQLIDFPLREQRLNKFIEQGIPWKFKYIKNNNKKNIIKIYNNSSKNAKNRPKFVRSLD